jgi:protein-disulfide isomerase
VRFAAVFLFVVTAGLLFAAHIDMVEGNPRGVLRVQIYEDLQCGDCARFETILQEKLLPKYGSRVTFVHHDFPLGKHDWARHASIASRWVYEQDPSLGIDFRRELLAEQNSINLQNLKPWMVEFAIRHHLDQKGIVESLKDPRLSALVDQDLMIGKTRGITKTPTVLAAGQTFVETIVYEDVAAAINEALK